MRKLMAAVVVAVLATPSSAHAWGFEAHRFIMDRAIALLPDAVRPLFEAHRAMVVERAIDPDTWRLAGFGADESPNHFLDLDWEGYGTYPFRELPRDYTAAVAKFGIDRIRMNGTLPWRVEEYFGNLRRAFQDYPGRGATAQFDVLFYAATLAHYVSDAHVPFHAVINYDGQLTNQHGLHARFESTTFERYRDRLTIAPKPARPITDPRNFAFDTIVEGTQLVPPILKADLAALGARDLYDDAYYGSFFAAVRPILERRINESITAVASLIAGAWEAAGKPAVPVTPPNTTQRKRRP